jgi:striatin 1/3/4
MVERKANGHAGSSKMSAMSKSSSDSNHGINTWKSVGAVPRDPKSRARSREYLKQYVTLRKHALINRCLQEITYLTSPGALNPLPPRPLIDEPESMDPKSTSEPIHEPERPTKALPNRALPSMFERPKEEPLVNGTQETSPPDAPPKTHLTAVTENSKPPSSPLVTTKSLPEEEGEMGYPEQSKQLLTAIYRPESKNAWRQELQTANERAERVSRVILRESS